MGRAVLVLAWVVLLSVGGCAKKDRDPAAHAGGPPQELVARFDRALAEWDLDAAEELLGDLEAHETPRHSINRQRTALGKRLLAPEMFDDAPVRAQRSAIEFTPVRLLGATSLGCSAAHSFAPVYAKAPARALPLLERAGATLDAFDAAYLAGELAPFERVWARLPAEQRSPTRMSQRARVLARQRRFADAIAQSEEVLTATSTEEVGHCAAMILAARMQEAQRKYAAARECYQRVIDQQAWGQCLNTAQSRLSVLASLEDGMDLAGFGVRVIVTAPPDAHSIVVLKSHEPFDGHIALQGWMNDNDPSSWHNADTLFGVPGHRDADGTWQFQDVPPGWYSIVVIVEGPRPAHPATDPCVGGVQVVDGPAEAGPIQIVWGA